MINQGANQERLKFMSEIKDPPSTTLDPKLRSIVESTTEDDKDFIFCAQCSHVITRRSERIEVNGSHSHNFTNPHGFAFHVGCFANALGCDISGSPQAADTWFMGYHWRYASCASCNGHLGWYFTNNHAANDFFYGIILDRVQEDT